MLRVTEYGVTVFTCDSCGMKAKVQDPDETERFKIFDRVTPLTLLIERYGWCILTVPADNHSGLTTLYYCPECWKKRMELAHKKYISDTNELSRAYQYQDVATVYEAYKKKIENEKG